MVWVSHWHDDCGDSRLPVGLPIWRFFLQTRFAVEFISQDFCRDLHGAHFFLSNGAWLVALSLCFQAGRDLIYLETFCHHRQ